MMVLWAAARAAEPPCAPVTDEEVRAVADRVRTEAADPADHEALVGDLLSRLTCTDPTRVEDPWTQLLLAEAHVHHAATREAVPLTPVALAVPAGGAAPPSSGEDEDGPLAAGPPEPQDEGGTARIKVRGPVPVRLEGWTGTFRRGKVPTGAYVVLVRPPPDFEPLQALAIYAATDDVWRVRCTRAGTCDAVRLAGEPPANEPAPLATPSAEEGSASPVPEGPPPAAGPHPSPLPEGEGAGSASSPASARILVEGDIPVELRGPCGTCGPGPVVPGTYQVLADFGRGEPKSQKSVRVLAGEAVTLRCSRLAQECSVVP